MSYTAIRKSKQSHGFSLIEFLLCLVIVGVLAGSLFLASDIKRTLALNNAARTIAQELDYLSRMSVMNHERGLFIMGTGVSSFRVERFNCDGFLIERRDVGLPDGYESLWQGVPPFGDRRYMIPNISFEASGRVVPGATIRVQIKGTSLASTVGVLHVVVAAATGRVRISD